LIADKGSTDRLTEAAGSKRGREGAPFARSLPSKTDASSVLTRLAANGLLRRPRAAHAIVQIIREEI
jgi:hypothetical protein